MMTTVRFPLLYLSSWLTQLTDISIDGSTNVAFTEDVVKRYESYNWEVLTVDNGDE